LKGWGFGRAEVFADDVKVAEGGEEGLGRVAEEKFGGEAADGDVSAADGVKEGRVRGRAEGAGDVSDEGRVFEVRDRRCSGVDGEGGDE
jgi:hypothetical protein